MSESPSLLQMIPVAPPFLLLFAPSRRAPDYEMQFELLTSEDDMSRRQLPVIVEVLTQGKCIVDREVLEPVVTSSLRREFGVADDGFLLVAIDDDGTILRRFDSPTKTSAIIRAFAAEAENPPD